MQKRLGRGSGLATWLASAAAVGVFLTAAVVGVLALVVCLPLLLVLIWLLARRKVPFMRSQYVVFGDRADGRGKVHRPEAETRDNRNDVQGACYDLDPSEYSSRPVRDGRDAANAR